MDIGNIKEHSDLNFEVAQAKKNALEKMRSRQLMAYNERLFKADANTINLVSTLKQHNKDFYVLDVNDNPCHVNDPDDFLNKLIERNQGNTERISTATPRSRNKEKIMTIGVLMYCFDTPEVNYHKLAERCVEQIRKYLKLEITIVTNLETYKKFKPLGMINYKLVEAKTTNTRPYRGKSIAWYNKERALAYEHSPYDTTILMDCDYFVFSSTLLELANTRV